MTYRCSVCKKRVEGDVMVYMDHTEQHIIEMIRFDHPNWVDKNGLCPKCVDYYRKQMKGEGNLPNG